MRKIRKDFHDYIPFILVIVLIFTSLLFSTGSTYADNIKVLGDSEGLKIIPKDTKMFDLNNLNPGDSHESEIVLENQYTDCYLEIFLRTERASREPNIGEADLFKQLKLRVYLEEDLIYSGSMKDFAKANTSLGNFDKNQSKKMKVIVDLPGKETGNEFQGKEVLVNWIFLAQSDCPLEPPDKPEPGEPEPPVEPEPPIKPEPPVKPEPGPQGPQGPPGPQGPSGPGIEPARPGGGQPIVTGKLDRPVKEFSTKKPQSMVGRLVQTGATPDSLYFALGGLMLVFGIGVYRKKK